jgi:methyl-accepting chemotaxis protein
MIVYLIHFCAILVVFVGMLFVPLMTKLNSGGLTALEEQQVANQFLVLHSQLWPALSVVLVLLVLHSFVVSHRIAGPLYRLKGILKSIGDGDFNTRVSFRKNDYLAHSTGDLNAMVQSLALKMKDLDSTHRAAVAALTDLKRSLAGGHGERANDKLEELGVHMNNIERWIQLHRFPMDATWPGPPVVDEMPSGVEEVGVES